MMMARASENAAHIAAVFKPGVKVCRVLLVGIAERDWIRGEVTEAGSNRIRVRLDDPGQHPHVIEDRSVTKGAVVSSAAAEWTRCP